MKVEYAHCDRKFRVFRRGAYHGGGGGRGGGCEHRAIAGAAALLLVAAKDVMVGPRAEGEWLAVTTARVAGERAHADREVHGIWAVLLISHALELLLRPHGLLTSRGEEQPSLARLSRALPEWCVS